MAKETKDPGTLVQLIDGWIDRNCPAMHLDAILNRPADAMKMGGSVALTQQKISNKEAAAFFAWLATGVRKFPQQMEAVEEVLRGAHNLRKQSKLKHRKKK